MFGKANAEPMISLTVLTYTHTCDPRFEGIFDAQFYSTKLVMPSQNFLHGLKLRFVIVTCLKAKSYFIEIC